MNNPVAWVYPDFFENLEKFDVWSAYKENFDSRIPLYTHPMRELTDEEINKLWAESHEDGIAVQQGFTTQQHYFAHLILRKASEK